MRTSLPRAARRRLRQQGLRRNEINRTLTDLFEQLQVMAVQLAEPIGGDIGRGRRHEYPGICGGFLDVDRADRGVRVRRTQQRGVGLPIDRDIVEVAPGAANEAAVLFAPDRLAYPELHTTSARHTRSNRTATEPPRQPMAGFPAPGRPGLFLRFSTMPPPCGWLRCDLSKIAAPASGVNAGIESRYHAGMRTHQTGL